ncbi:MAG: ribosomal RNA large subunit methyltransferase I [Litorilinea sp.]|nr:MAG: ribosomal RNA large subunit methyltransferase I [Litorilinea sp.]
MATDRPLPQVRLKPGREKPVRQFHPWIFSGAIAHMASEAVDGELVDVVDAQGNWLARGYLNRASQIQVRLLTWDPGETIDDRFWQRRLAEAVRQRQHPTIQGQTDAYRLVNGESDGLPGLIVDRYGPFLVLQAGTLAIDRRKEALAQMLLTLTGCQGVLERSEMAARRQEGLPDATGLLAGTAPTGPVEVHEGPLRFLVDLLGGQKTGFYTDQRENRRRVALYCQGARVLNAFSYTGAFAVHALAAGATHVVNIDSSVAALELGEANLRLNGFDPDAQAESIAGDVFQILRDWRDQPGRPAFDVVILDPPKFVQSRRNLERGLRGYKDINMLGMQMVRPGGILVTFSCSGLVSLDLFQKVLFGASLDVGREVQILEWLHQAPDHPVALHFPEGEYLQGFLCRVGQATMAASG